MSGVRFETIFLRALEWGMVGMIVSPLLIGIREIFVLLGMGYWALIPAAAIAGAAGAAFYGSLLVAIIATIVGITASTAVLAVAQDSSSPGTTVLISALAGAVVGAILQFPKRFSHGVPGKTMAGFTGGIAAGVIVSLISLLNLPEPEVGFLAGLSVALIGYFYAKTETWWISRMQNLFSRGAIEILVSAGLAGVAGGAMGLFGGRIIGRIDPPYDGLVHPVFDQLPVAVVGGIIGAALMGMLLEFTSVTRRDMGR